MGNAWQLYIRINVILHDLLDEVFLNIFLLTISSLLDQIFYSLE